MSIETLSWASSVDAPRCGVTVAPASPMTGWSFGGGSASKTSSAAPAITPSFRASASAFSSRTPPRELFTIRAVLFILRNSAAPMSPTVFSVSGGWSVMKSEISSRRSSSTSSTPRTSARSRTSSGSKATTRIPNARPYRATCPPTLPRPTMPSVLPSSSTPTFVERSHFPARIWASARAISRALARRRAKACSAADVTLPSGAFMTMTPRRLAASTSMLSTPIPARPMSLSLGPASMTSLVTLTALRTMRPSAEATAARRSSGFSFPRASTSIPPARRTRAHSSATSSAMRTRATLFSRAFEILARPGVDPDDFALRDERGHLHDGAGLELRRLVDVGDRRALQLGLGLHHLQVDGGRELDLERAPVEEVDLDGEVLLQELRVVAQDVLVELDLLVVLPVHEDVVRAALVEVLVVGH